MLERMRENQKRHYKNRKSTHTFKIGDLVLLKKHNKENLSLNGNLIIGSLNPITVVCYCGRPI